MKDSNCTNYWEASLFLFWFLLSYLSHPLHTHTHLPTPAHTSLAVSHSLPLQTCLPLLIYLPPFKDGQCVTVERSSESKEEEAGEEEGVCTMQSRASVAKVGRLRWGVSIARVHWCMNAVKSNASLNRQEGVGKVKPARWERAAVHRRQGASFSPSFPLSLFLSSLFVCTWIPLIYLFVFVCVFFFYLKLAVTISPILWHGRGHSPNKVHWSQRESSRNTETQLLRKY